MKKTLGNDEDKVLADSPWAKKEHSTPPPPKDQDVEIIISKSDTKKRTVERVTRTVTSNGEETLVDLINTPKPEKRPSTRYSFEFYIDQLVRLKNIRHAIWLKTGKTIPASKFVREALDEKLDKLEKELL